MNEMNETEEEMAFYAFRQGDLGKLDFIPNVQELRDNFGTAMAKECCGERQRTLLEHRNIFLEALRASNQ